MNKKILLIVLIVVILALVGGGYYYWKTQIQKSPAEQAVDNLQKTTESISDAAVQGTIPTIDTVTNPLENAPNTNPYSNTNPFSDINVNPFK